MLSDDTISYSEWVGAWEVAQFISMLERARPTWTAGRACRKETHHFFFPGQGEKGFVPIAKAICATCPVRMECLGAAIENHEDGTWGGSTADERKAWRDAGLTLEECFEASLS